MRQCFGRFAGVLSQVPGKTAPCVLQLLNFAVACLDAGEAYDEVSRFPGSILVGALLVCNRIILYSRNRQRPGQPAIP